MYPMALPSPSTTTRADPVAKEVAERNSFAPDLAVDIHNNVGGGDGAEAFYSRVGGTGEQLAENILAHITKLGQKSRGAKTRTTASGADMSGNFSSPSNRYVYN